MQHLNLRGMTQEITGGTDPGSAALTRRGYIYTDRSTYQAGETLHFRGIIRDVKDGAYFVPEGREYLVRVLGWEAANRRAVDAALRAIRAAANPRAPSHPCPSHG